MIVYGSYGLLFLAGVSILTFLTFGRVTERALKTFSDMEIPQFLLLLAAILVISMVLLSGSVALIGLMVGFVLLVLLPIAFYLLAKKEIIRRTWRKEEENAEVAKFEAILKKGEDKTVGHLGLARVYERYGRFQEAAQEYRILGGAFADDESGYSERMEQKERLMRQMHEAEERAKTMECPNCERRNRPQQRRCSQCNSELYGNAFLWVWKNTNVYTRVAAVSVVIISALYSIWLPFTLSIALVLIWLGVIVYMSLPLEAVLLD